MSSKLFVAGIALFAFAMLWLEIRKRSDEDDRNG